MLLHAAAHCAPPLHALRVRSRRRRAAACCCPSARGGSDVVARWSIDARFGCKSAALALLREWVLEVATQAGARASDARLLAGQLGAPESRLELELRFDSLSALETFFEQLPGPAHAAWGARLAPVVCDGSPTWRVLRTVSLDADAASPLAAVAVVAAPPLPVRRTDSGLFITGTEALPTDAPVELDWKGDPVVWAPGDKRPSFTPQA